MTHDNFVIQAITFQVDITSTLILNHTMPNDSTLPTVTLPLPTSPVAQTGLVTPVNRSQELKGSIQKEEELKKPQNEPKSAPITSSAIALSFAFDAVNRSLDVVMTDKTSGEVIRKFSYTGMHPEVHQTDKLTGLVTGLLLDQMV